MRRLRVVGVMGSGTDPHEDRASPLGRWLATQPVHLLTGGHGGVMESVSRAFAESRGRRGLVIGVLRAGVPENPYVEIAIRTHLAAHGEHGADPLSRNHLNVLSSDLIIALPGGPGTRTEIELALRYGRPTVAFLRDVGELAGLPSAIPLASTLEDVQRFVRELA